MTDMRLEVVTLPVSDVDRAVDFYAGRVGFRVDHDTRLSDTVRLVQLTPPGSECSIHLGTGLPEMAGVAPGSVKRLHLVVDDVAEVREGLLGRGVPVSAVDVYRGGVRMASFSDPDGNSWVLQQMGPSHREQRTGE